MTLNEMKQALLELKAKRTEISNAWLFSPVKVQREKTGVKTDEYMRALSAFNAVHDPIQAEIKRMESAIRNHDETIAAQNEHLTRYAKIMAEVERYNAICNDDGNSPYSG